MDASCIILAGGKSSRLGYNKVLQTVGKRSLLEETISRISLLCNELIVVTAQKQAIPELTSNSNLTIVQDVLPNKGPLVGIYTGLIESTSPYSLVVAADMPFLNQNLLRYLLRLAVNFDLAVPIIGNKLEPLHAVYTKNCLTPIEAMIKQDNLSVNKLARTVRTRYVGAEEIERFDPEYLSFFNINTEADLEKARKLAGGATEN